MSVRTPQKQRGEREVIMCTRHTKTGIKTDRDGKTTWRADIDRNSSGDGQTVRNINITNMYEKPNVRTDTRAGD